MAKVSQALLDEIKKIPLLLGIPHDNIVELLQTAHLKQLQAGEFFFMQGDQPDRMFILIKGRVKLRKIGVDGQQVLIRVITPVHLFALVGMIQAKEYLVTAQAADDSQALFWTSQELMKLVQQIPQLAQNAMRIMAGELQEIQERFRQVSSERVERRLARTLLRLAGESGKKVEEGILINLPLTRQDLAEMSGTTLFTASRMLSQWEDQELVIAGRERVIIRNMHGLAKIVENDPA